MSTYFKADFQEIKKLTTKIVKINPRLDPDEVIEGKNIINQFQCLICMSLLINPV